jgi:hypothetical protein
VRKGLAIALGVVAVSAPPASAADRAPLAFAIQDDPRLLDHPATLDADLAEARSLGFTHVRVTAHWDQLTLAPRAARPPRFDAADPAAYPADRWAPLDRLVRHAAGHGLEVMIDAGFFAPRWATRGSPPGDPRPRNRIDPFAFRDFAVAVARRYSGAYRPDPELPALPRVGLIELWNEVNLPVFWTPQRAVDRRGRIWMAGAAAYRRLVRIAYPAIKAVRPDATVLVGDLASGPAWDPTARKAGVPALRYLRELACVDAALRPLRTPGCAGFQPLLGDGFAVHPYALGGSPARRPGGNRAETLTMGNVDRLIGLLHTLAARGRIAPGLQDVYATEFGYLTRVVEPGAPPLSNPFPTVSPDRQAEWELLAHELAWRHPEIKLFSHFLIRDTICARDAGSECVDWSSGYRFSRGTPKPLFDSLHAGVLWHPLTGGGDEVWMRLGSPAARASAVLQYHRDGGPWRTVTPDDVRWVDGGKSDGILDAGIWPLGAIEYRVVVPG